MHIPLSVVLQQQQHQASSLFQRLDPVLVLNFAEVTQLTEDYYAPGSLGPFNLQLQVAFVNNHHEEWLAREWELSVIPMNSGIILNGRGTSSVYTALLTKADVLDASDQENHSHGAIKRLIGGGLHSSLKNRL